MSASRIDKKVQNAYLCMLYDHHLEFDQQDMGYNQFDQNSELDQEDNYGIDHRLQFVWVGTIVDLRFLSVCSQIHLQTRNF